MRRPHLCIAMTAVAMACVTRTQTMTPHEVTAVGTSGGTDEVQALVQLALVLDAAGDAKADTLYAPDALVIGNARVRTAAPRFAGIIAGPDGQMTVTVASATVEGRLAWVDG